MSVWVCLKVHELSTAENSSESLIFIWDTDESIIWCITDFVEGIFCDLDLILVWVGPQWDSHCVMTIMRLHSVSIDSVFEGLLTSISNCSWGLRTVTINVTWELSESCWSLTYTVHERLYMSWISIGYTGHCSFKSAECNWCLDQYPQSLTHLILKESELRSCFKLYSVELSNELSQGHCRE